MKKQNMIAAGAVTLFAVWGLAQSSWADNSLNITGTVSQLLMNPEGDVDGLLLSDGTQVKFPPHMAGELTATVAAKDKVKIAGFKENAKVFKAEAITNTKTNKSVTDTPPPAPGEVGARVAPPPPPPPGGPRGPRPPHERDRLNPLSAEGKIEHQLFGPRGDVNGVILSSGAIIHVGPRAMDNSKVDLAVGKKLKASGFGTKNQFGESFEATELSNL